MESDEGPRLAHSSCAALAKLMLHGQFVKMMLDATATQKQTAGHDLSKHVVALVSLAPLAAVTEAAQSTLAFPFKYPSLPYVKNQDMLLRGLGPGTYLPYAFMAHYSP